MKSFYTLTILLLSVSLRASGQLKSGDYDEMQLAFNPSTQKVSGYYSTASGGGQFSCIFYLEGELKGKTAKVLTYYPQDKAASQITGALSLKSNQLVLLQLQEEHGGCWNASPIKFKEGDRFQLSQAQPWMEIRYVNQERAYFSKQANESSKTKVYVIKGDVLMVTKKQNGWVFCQYRGKKLVEGWIKEEGLNKL